MKKIIPVIIGSLIIISIVGFLPFKDLLSRTYGLTTSLKPIVKNKELVGFFPIKRLVERDQLVSNKEYLAQFAIIILIALLFLKNPWLKGYLIWSVIGSVWIFRNGFDLATYMPLVIITLSLVLYQMLLEKVKPVHLLNIICILILIQLIWMYFQEAGIWIFLYPKVGKHLGIEKLEVSKILWKHIVITPRSVVKYYPITGLLPNINWTSALLAIGLPAFFRKKWFWGIPLVWLGLCFSKSWGGIIPAFLATLWFIWIKTPFRWQISIVTLTFLLGIISVPIASKYVHGVNIREFKIKDNSRLDVWKDVWKTMIIKKPIVGYGPGQFKKEFPPIHRDILKSKWAKTDWTRAHNEFIQLFAEQGIIGVFLILGFLISVIWKGIKKNSYIVNIALVAIIIALLNSSINFVMHTVVGFLVIIWFVILEKEGGKYYEENLT